MTRITFETIDHVARIGLSRAEKRNAFDLAMLDALSQAYTRYEDDRDLRCAVLFAHGDHFTGGLDLAEVGPAVARGRALFSETLVDPVALGPRRLSKPLVVAIQGWCLTIGIELALAGDIRIASDDAKFGQIEIKRGILPFGGATLRMTTSVGWGNAMRYLLTGDTFDAAEAHRIGMVQEVVGKDRLLAHATELANRIAAQSPLGVQATLASCRSAATNGVEQEIALLGDRARALMATEDAAEGMRAFVERRAGVFHGK